MVGLTTVDVMHVLDRALDANEKTTARAQFVAAGGPAANAAVTAAGLGADATLITALGDHPLAELARADLTRHRVRVIDVLGEHTKNAPPPLSLIRIVTASGERSVSSLNDGALGEALASTADRAVGELIASSDATLIDGYYPRLLDTYHAELAGHEHLIVDLGSWKASYAPLLPFADVVAASADAQLPGGGPVLGGLVAFGVRIAMTTDGPHPVRYQSAHEAGEVAVAPTDAIDTLGAGDVFHGALCAARAFHRDAHPAQLARFAASVGARKAGCLGPRTYLAELTDLQLPLPEMGGEQ